MPEPGQNRVARFKKPPAPKTPVKPIDVTEPRFRFWQVAVMCGFPNMMALYNYLHKHPEITRKYREGSYRWHGYLHESQVRQIQENVYHDFDDSPFSLAGRPKKNKSMMNGWIGRVVKAATQ